MCVKVTYVRNICKKYVEKAFHMYDPIFNPKKIIEERNNNFNNVSYIK